jgi:lipocalin
LDAVLRLPVRCMHVIESRQRQCRAEVEPSQQRQSEADWSKTGGRLEADWRKRPRHCGGINNFEGKAVIQNSNIQGKLRPLSFWQGDQLYFSSWVSWFGVHVCREQRLKKLSIQNSPARQELITISRTAVGSAVRTCEFCVDACRLNFNSKMLKCHSTSKG